MKKDIYIQGINGVPCFIIAGPVSGIFACKEKLGYNYSYFILTFENDYCEFGYHKKDLERIKKEFMKRVNPNYMKWVYENIEIDKKPVYDYLKEIDKIKNLSDKDLIKEYQKLCHLYYFSFGTSHLVEAVALTTDSEIKEKLQKTLIKLNKSNKFTEYFTKLTQPTKNFFISAFNKSLNSIVDKVKKKQNADKLIEKHLKDFFWIKCQWNFGKDYTKEEVMDEVDEIIKNKTKLEVTDDKQLEENKKIKKELFKELDQELIDLINITDEFTYIQDDRKVLILVGVWMLEKFVQEIAKRFDIDPGNLKYLLPDEMSIETLKSKTIEPELIERRKGSAYIYDKNKRSIVIGKEYEELKKEVAQTSEEVKELNGLCACAGKVIGRVKICVKDNQIKEVNQGDILVTSMTRPEFVPAMKKAVAIVTDEGGITSHAAVISRELKVPCVIGTKNATKVLKDNELVEVNANHGLVKIIR